MPRFFFHIQTINGVNEEDNVGADFASERDAIEEARALANELMLDAARARHNVKQVIEVADAHGNTIIRIDCTSGMTATVAGPGLRDQKR
jgi:dihydroxyacetone kinase DhaKLM complex PTS-EIIA-like component DhaM